MSKADVKLKMPIKEIMISIKAVKMVNLSFNNSKPKIVKIYVLQGKAKLIKKPKVAFETITT